MLQRGYDVPASPTDTFMGSRSPSPRWGPSPQQGPACLPACRGRSPRCALSTRPPTPPQSVPPSRLCQLNLVSVPGGHTLNPQPRPSAPCQGCREQTGSHTHRGVGSLRAKVSPSEKNLDPAEARRPFHHCGFQLGQVLRVQENSDSHS